ncbi:MAG: GTP 3',8-cyclase MoaA, partial [Synechocystis sp.]|nr:GTP 3',8-cyclase MoaA [Synechocystis sp.]
EEIRLTGGEPFLRREFPDIVTRLAALPLKKIGITTNGILLDRYCDLLKSLNILDLNISLDSLNPTTFNTITHGDYLAKIIANIQLATQAGFRVKTNTVIMKGINDHEIEDFIRFAQKHNVTVRFLEVMRIGYACHQQSHWFIPAQTLINRLRQRHTLTPVSTPLDATAFEFVTETGVQLGFIASESQPFCGHCSRWRLAADGMLRACLLKETGLSLKGRSPLERQSIYQQLLGMKPYLRPPEVSHAMHQIGG